MKTTLALRTAAAAAALSFCLVPAAEAAKLSGTTKDGSKITLKRSGAKVSAIKTMVPAMCVETTGSGRTRAGGELFTPPGSFVLGGQRKTKAVQPAAMN